MKLSLLMVLAFLLAFGTNSSAQEFSVRKKILDGIRKEKLRVRTPTQTDNLSTLSEAERKTRGSDKRLSNVTANEEGEGYISINPKNTLQLAAGYMDNQNALVPIEYRLYTTSNGGSTWGLSGFQTGTQFLNDFPGYLIAGGGDPVLEYDADGKLHYSWIYLGLLPNLQTGNIDSTVAVMYHATSTNNGQSFTLAAGDDKFIAKTFLDFNTFEAIPGSTGFHDRQWFAIDLSNGPNKNALYCSFIYFNTPAEPLSEMAGCIKKLAAGASSFSARNKALPGAVQFNNVRVDNTGVLHMTGANVDFNTVVYSKSTDGGNTFSAPVQVAAGNNLFGNQDNGYYHGRENAATNLAVDANGKAHVVWSDFTVATSENVVSYYCNNTGTGFGTPVDLATVFNTSRRVFMPTVCAFQNRLSIGAYIIDALTKQSSYFTVHSANAGATWGSPVLVSADSFRFDATTNVGKWFGDYNNAVRTETKVYHIWSDGRGTKGPKMYLGITEEWPTAITEISPLNGEIEVSTAYPVPATSAVQMNIVSQNNAVLRVQVCDAGGKVVHTASNNVVAGKSTLSISLAQLAAGTYVVNIAASNGERFVRRVQKL